MKKIPSSINLNNKCDYVMNGKKRKLTFKKRKMTFKKRQMNVGRDGGEGMK